MEDGEAQRLPESWVFRPTSPRNDRNFQDKDRTRAESDCRDLKVQLRGDTIPYKDTVVLIHQGQ